MNIRVSNLLNQSKTFLRKQNLFLPIGLILFTYCFIAFLPLPWPITIGLDSSWSYAISQASQNQWIFGQDIIFTYGPLGYLTTGTALDENLLQILFFRWFVYLLLFIISILRIITLKNPIQQLFIGLSIVLALFIGTPYIGVGMSTDYQILFIFLIILSFEKLIKKYPRSLPLILGSISGFCTLTKLTLGIYTLGALNLLLLVNLYQSLRRRAKKDLVNNLFAIANSCLSSISIALIFLAPHQSPIYFSKILFTLIISAIIGALIKLGQDRIKTKSKLREKTQFQSSNSSRINQFLPWFIFYLVYFVSLVYIIFSTSSPSLIDYLKNSLEISLGYSSAMSIVGGKMPIALAISDFFLIACLMLFLDKKKHLNLFCPLFFVLFLSFKHGFIRQDGHVVAFAMLVPLIASLLITKISKFYYQKISYYFFIYILIASALISIPGFPIGKFLWKSSPPDNSVIWVSTHNQSVKKTPLSIKLPGPIKKQVQKLMPDRIVDNLGSLIDVKKIQSKIEQGTKNNLAYIQLPDRVKHLVKSKPIDIIPWEISLVPANQLNWKPRPIFQSYSAYTATLDNINFDSLSTEVRDYLFYKFRSIDKRHPFFDEPKTFFYIFCNYQPSAAIPDLIDTPEYAHIILLENLQTSRCSSTSQGEISSIPWNIPYAIKASHGTIIRARVKVQYSPIGKLYKTIFRAPPVMIKVDYIDGSEKTYRIIPENSENGVIVSHLPKGDSGALSFFQGQSPAPVKSIRFQPSNTLLYTPNIEIRPLVNRKMN